MYANLSSKFVAQRHRVFRSGLRRSRMCYRTKITALKVHSQQFLLAPVVSKQAMKFRLRTNMYFKLLHKKDVISRFCLRRQIVCSRTFYHRPQGTLITILTCPIGPLVLVSVLFNKKWTVPFGCSCACALHVASVRVRVVFLVFVFFF